MQLEQLIPLMCVVLSITVGATIAFSVINIKRRRRQIAVKLHHLASALNLTPDTQYPLLLTGSWQGRPVLIRYKENATGQDFSSNLTQTLEIETALTGLGVRLASKRFLHGAVAQPADHQALKDIFWLVSGTCRVLEPLGAGGLDELASVTQEPLEDWGLFLEEERCLLRCARLWPHPDEVKVALDRLVRVAQRLEKLT